MVTSRVEFFSLPASSSVTECHFFGVGVTIEGGGCVTMVLFLQTWGNVIKRHNSLPAGELLKRTESSVREAAGLEITVPVQVTALHPLALRAIR